MTDRKDAPTAPVIVREGRFGAPDATAFEDLAESADPDALDPALLAAPGIRIRFPAFSDGRGFSLARALRRGGYEGRLRAAGHVISDQYRMALNCGFDEIEIPADLARRQPEGDWAIGKSLRYLDRLR